MHPALKPFPGLFAFNTLLLSVCTSSTPTFYLIRHELLTFSFNSPLLLAHKHQQNIAHILNSHTFSYFKSLTVSRQPVARDCSHTCSSPWSCSFFVLPLVAMDLPVVSVLSLKVVSCIIKDFLPSESFQSMQFSLVSKHCQCNSNIHAWGNRKIFAHEKLTKYFFLPSLIKIMKSS